MTHMSSLNQSRNRDVHFVPSIRTRIRRDSAIPFQILRTLMLYVPWKLFVSCLFSNFQKPVIKITDFIHFLRTIFGTISAETNRSRSSIGSEFHGLTCPTKMKIILTWIITCVFRIQLSEKFEAQHFWSVIWSIPLTFSLPISRNCTWWPRRRRWNEKIDRGTHHILAWSSCRYGRRRLCSSQL